MTEIGTSTHLPVLDEPHERKAVGHELEVTLHELVDLSLIGKQLHWAVVGPLFRPLHLHLDEMVDSWRELSDTVAERAVALGYIPDGQAQAVAAGSPLTPLAQGPVEDHAVIWALVQRITKVSELVRARMDRLGEIDLASQDVLIDVVRALEEQQWMLRVQLTGRPEADHAVSLRRPPPRGPFRLGGLGRPRFRGSPPPKRRTRLPAVPAGRSRKYTASRKAVTVAPDGNHCEMSANRGGSRGARRLHPTRRCRER